MNRNKSRNEVSLFRSVISTALSITVMYQSVFFTWASTANAAEQLQVASAAPISHISIIENAMKRLHLSVDSGVDQNLAISEFVATIAGENLSIDDIKSYALLISDTQDYEKFEKYVSIATSGLSSTNASSAEFATLLGMAVKNGSSEGLSWAGCGGYYAGIALAIGALVVGIVALTKTASAQSVKSDYDSKIANANRAYNDNSSYYINWKTTIPADMKSIKDTIATDQQGIAYYNGVIAGADPNSVNYSSIVQNANKYISDYNYDISLRTTDLNRLQSLYESFANNSSALQNILDGLKADHDAQVASLESAKQNDIASVPDNHKLAGTLGIVAGVSAVVSTVLIVDGSHSCN